MKFKRTLLTMGTIATIAGPVAAVVSCGKIDINYDFGLATSSINSLNYVKNKDTQKVAPALIDGLIKTMPSSKSLVNKLKLPPLKLDTVDKDGKWDGGFLDLDQIGYSAAVIHNSVNDFVSFVSQYDGTNKNEGINSVGIQLNEGDSKWSNGEAVTAADFVDTFKYILDLNTGSQYLTDILDLNIKGTQEIIDAQTAYFKTTGVSYNDPFGYDGGWESQSPNDSALVNDIKTAAESLGYYTAETKKPSWADKAFGGTGAEHQVEAKYQLFIEFDDSAKPGWTDPILMFTKAWLSPINRKFVESHGGIRKFGTDKETFLWNGPFNPDELVLGPQGHITLSKREDYFSADKTISDKIKIYFQDKPVITSSMFDDGYVSATDIPAAYMMKFWSDPDVRPLMKKSNGYGTIGFQLNLDKNTATNKSLQDQDFRKALEYSIDRNEMLKMTGWDSSFPVTTWTAYGNAKDQYGMPIETYFDKESYKPYEGAETMPIQSYSWLDHKAKDYKFESVEREDKAHKPELANHFMDIYKAKAGSPSKVTLKYIYDGTPAGKNAGIALQAQMNEAFGGYVDVEIKGLPSNVFETYRTAGTFDILYMNFDSYGSTASSYVKRFISPDAIDESVGKTTGFKLNPSGSWTYDSYLKEANNGDITRAEKLFDPNKTDHTEFDALWNKFKSLVVKKDAETSAEVYKRTNTFFSGNDSDAVWKDNEKIISIISLMEKVIKDGAPVLPLMEVDTKWMASRMLGAGELFSYSLQFAYDVDRKPDPTLPGREALEG